MKRPAAIAADPDIVVRSPRDSSYGPGSSVGFRWLQGLAAVQQSALFIARAHADPETTLSVSLQSVDEIAARFTDNLGCPAGFDQENAAALSARVKFLAHQRQAR